MEFIDTVDVRIFIDHQMAKWSTSRCQKLQTNRKI